MEDIPSILTAAFYNLRLWMLDLAPLSEAPGAYRDRWNFSTGSESLSARQLLRVMQGNEWLH